MASANARSHHSKVISRGVRYDKEFGCLMLVSFKEKHVFVGETNGISSVILGFNFCPESSTLPFLCLVDDT